MNEILSVDDARWASDLLREATNIHGINQTFNRDHYYLSNILMEYADFLETQEMKSMNE